MDITVFGMGYVGCVTAASCLADMGHSVKGVDLQETKVSLINAGKSPVVELALGDLILRGVDAGRLQATQRVQRLGDLSLICVGTPGNENGSLDLSQVERVASEIGDLLGSGNSFHVVVIRSTRFARNTWNKGQGNSNPTSRSRLIKPTSPFVSKKGRDGGHRADDQDHGAEHSVGGTAQRIRFAG
jgi:nucleotide sugar dehydrogenase